MKEEIDKRVKLCFLIMISFSSLYYNLKNSSPGCILSLLKIILIQLRKKQVLKLYTIFSLFRSKIIYLLNVCSAYCQKQEYQFFSLNIKIIMVQFPFYLQIFPTEHLLCKSDISFQLLLIYQNLYLDSLSSLGFLFLDSLLHLFQTIFHFFLKQCSQFVHHHHFSIRRYNVIFYHRIQLVTEPVYLFDTGPHLRFYLSFQNFKHFTIFDSVFVLLKILSLLLHSYFTQLRLSLSSRARQVLQNPSFLGSFFPK